MANVRKKDFSAATVTVTTPATEVLTELLAAFRDPDPDLDHIVELINVVPSLTAEVLRRRNSVMFAGCAPAVDVFEAVSRIGMYEAYSAIVSLTSATRAGGLVPARLTTFR